MALFIFLILLKMRILLKQWKNLRRVISSPVLFLGLMQKEKEYHLSLALNFNTLKSKILKKLIAQVVELVDTRDLKSLEGNFVPVQVRLWAPSHLNTDDYIH